MQDISGMGPTVEKVGNGIKDIFNWSAESMPGLTKWGTFIMTALIGGHFAQRMLAYVNPNVGNSTLGTLACYGMAMFLGNHLGNMAVGAGKPEPTPDLATESTTAAPAAASAAP